MPCGVYLEARYGLHRVQVSPGRNDKRRDVSRRLLNLNQINLRCHFRCAECCVLIKELQCLCQKHKRLPI